MSEAHDLSWWEEHPWDDDRLDDNDVFLPPIPRKSKAVTEATRVPLIKLFAVAWTPATQPEHG